jgi:uncharacterized membrane protein YuzA (DUF378 family)
MSKLNVGLQIALIVLIVGGLNWGLVGLFQFDLAAAILGQTFVRIAYVVAGLSSLAFLVPTLVGRLSPKTVRTQGSVARPPSVS